MAVTRREMLTGCATLVALGPLSPCAPPLGGFPQDLAVTFAGHPIDARQRSIQANYVTISANGELVVVSEKGGAE